MYPHYLSEANLTPSAVKIQKDLLRAYELEQFSFLPIETLIANRTEFCDDLLKHLWEYMGLAAQADLALIAVGGYGRKELFPLSDLDFLILSSTELNPQTEQKIAEFVQFLWDCHFDLGHSVRTLSQCLDEGKQDITIATNLLESRCLCGNEMLFQQLENAIYQDSFWSEQAFFSAKMQERTERYQRYHNTSYNLEPDIKYSPGGLRDLHLLYWIALRHAKARNLDELLQTGFIYPEEYEQLKNSQQFLFRTRFALHLSLKRYDNRLLFERQRKVSEMLGFSGEANVGVESMMRCFFQALQSISVLSDILTKHYQEHILVDNNVSNSHYLDHNFILENHAICLKNQWCFIEQPETILDLFFYLTQYPQAEIHSDTLRKLMLALSQITTPLSFSQPIREKFLSLFKQPNGISRAILPMHKYGVLTVYLPNWQPIVGLMQFDLFHAYTVDEHTLRVMLKLESFLNKDNSELHPLCTTIFPLLPDRSLLYLAALFHDIAKGRGGDHAQLGAEDMRDFAVQHGFSASDTELMVWLVRQHLFMSVVAQRRDIYDPEVVLAFANEVKNQNRLDYLACLTVADICATNSTLWNDWKRSLLATLYQYCVQQLQQGMDNLVDYQDKIDEHRQKALKLLPSLDQEKVLTFWARCPEDYFLRNTPKQIAWHTTLLCEYDKDILIKVSNQYAKGGTEIFIYCADQPHLFSKVVSMMGAKNVSIHDAQIITGQDGYVFDSFIVSELDGKALRSDRRRELEKALMSALTSEKITKQSQRVNRKLQHFSVPTCVRFLNTEKTEQTEMELFTLDKPGLLIDISLIFNALNLNLLNAKITTVGERAEDFFILCNNQNQALSEAERQQLDERLHFVLG
ncbi:bifunctional uridylyltransferase/uridylyl-removing protein GlnD [Conservatibacter flavescens]|uniref:Bifunctional uridylyltransferase/uridylyl-removing enzyme n=1 Tax=Conservatibacter flavescens TaxID=28161 RepID=A0A2M8S5V0_9PAST|nr:bifunctional uridylyltransferase/uridylyl-removing protein GlnD [Conservatibacter flavescens]PJG86488.1 [protein-PII] uridylyltransferase [Conservatibacter flavescens]